MTQIKITFAALGLMLSVALSGQTYLGLKTGVNISNPQLSNTIDAINDLPKSNSTILIGAVTEVSMTDNFSLQPELHYIRKGFTVSESTSLNALGLNIPIGARATTTINYVDVPLLAKVKVGVGTTRFYGVIGPTVGYALSANVQPQVTLLLDLNLPTVDIDLSDSQYRRTNLGATLGAGVEHQFGAGKIFTDVRYQQNFTSLVDNTIVDINLKNNGTQISFGYAHSF